MRVRVSVEALETLKPGRKWSQSYLLCKANINTERTGSSISGQSCNRGWAFTRVAQYEFVGIANEEVREELDRDVTVQY